MNIGCQEDHSSTRTHQPPNPYSLCVRERLRNLKAESPSKNCVSGMVPATVSRLNHPRDMAFVGLAGVYKDYGGRGGHQADGTRAVC